MSRTFGPIRLRGPLLLVLVSLAACSGPSPGRNAGLLGYGTPGVESYVQPERASSLRAQLDLCSQVAQANAASQTRGLPAACGQLQRTVPNQPGNSVRQ